MYLVSGSDPNLPLKHNKTHTRGYNKEFQQQKQYHRYNNSREQRSAGSLRYRNDEQNNGHRVSFEAFPSYSLSKEKLNSL